MTAHAARNDAEYDLQADMLDAMRTMIGNFSAFGEKIDKLNDTLTTEQLKRVTNEGAAAVAMERVLGRVDALEKSNTSKEGWIKFWIATAFTMGGGLFATLFGHLLTAAPHH